MIVGPKSGSALLGRIQMMEKATSIRYFNGYDVFYGVGINDLILGLMF